MELKDWLNSINHTKDDLLSSVPDTIESYPPYIVNKCLSSHIDAIFFSNEMNINHHLNKDMQYLFYLNSLRKKKRFSPWIRKDKIDNLDIVKKYYNYSNEKAIQALKILTKEQLNFIKQKFEIGGTNK